MSNNTMAWVAHAETYPLLEGADYEEFKADILARGVQEPIKVRMLANGKKQGLDGRNRWNVCREIGVPCPEERVEVADADVPAYIDSLNWRRRHLSIDHRRDRVQQLRGEGKSVRQIAEALHVPKTTVSRDIQDARSAAGVPGGTPGDKSPSTKSEKPEPETITGRDGKHYQASAPDFIPEVAAMIGANLISPKLIDELRALSKPQQQLFVDLYNRKIPVRSAFEQARVGQPTNGQSNGHAAPMPQELGHEPKRKPSAKEKAKTAVGALIRALEPLGLFEKHRDALQAIKTDVMAWKAK